MGHLLVLTERFNNIVSGAIKLCGKIIVLFILGSLFWGATVFAVDEIEFDIKSQRADRALTVFAQTANLPVLFPNKDIRNITTNALQGRFTVDQGLKILLHETGLLVSRGTSDQLIVKIELSTTGDQIVPKEKPTNKKNAFIGVAAFLASVFSMSPGFAQAQQDAGASTLEEVVVTARKREESLMETPISISAFSSQTLEDMNLSSIDQIADQTPGLVFDSTSNISGSANSSSIFIRGIGQRDYTLAIEPGVGLYVDDVYLAHSIGNVLDIVDVERIEVLRGPQGTLFGRNTIGGAVRVVTKKPHEEFEGDAEVTVGSYNRLDVKGHINIPLSDNFFTRVSALSQDRDGFVDRPFLEGESGDKDNTSIVAQARWQASPNFTADTLISYTRDRSNGAPAILLTATPGVSGPETFRTVVAPALDPQINSFLFGPQFVGWDGDGCPCIDYSDTIIQQDLDTYSAALTLNWDVSDNLSVKSISSYRDLKSHFGRDGDHVPELQHVHLQFHTEYEQWSQEIQLSGTSFNDKLDWIVGGYYYFEEGQSDDTVQFVTLDLASGGNFETTNFAFFAQGTYHITDQLDLTVGARYTDEEKKAIIDDDHQIITAFLGAGPFKVPNSASFSVIGGSQTVKDSITEADPYVNLSYQWTEDLLTYFSYSQGFKGGGIQVRVGGGVNFLPRFAPEFATVYEIGAKWALLDGRLNISGAGFFTDYTDLQITANVTPPGGVPTSVVTNAGDAEITGFEIEFTALPTENLRLNGGVAYLDAEYTRLLSAPGIALDSDLPNAPEWQFNLSGSYEIHTSYGTFTPRVDYAYTDSQFNDAQNNALIRRGAVDMLNLSLGYSSVNGLWSGALYVTNALDEQVILAGFDGGFYGDGVVSRPAEWGLRIKRSF